jgi:hypothetical protein
MCVAVHCRYSVPDAPHSIKSTIVIDCLAKLSHLFKPPMRPENFISVLGLVAASVHVVCNNRDEPSQVARNRLVAAYV